MLFALVAILLVQTLAPVQANMLSRNALGDEIESFCANKDVNLSTFAQLKQLAEKVDNSKCSSAGSRVAITELAKVYEDHKEDICSMRHVKSLGNYFTWRLGSQFGSMLGKKIPEKIPDSLKKFAIAYGLQVSNMCKSNMLEALTGEEGRRKIAKMGDEVEGLFVRLTSDQGPVEHVLGDLGNRDEPLMPGDLDDFLNSYNFHEVPINVEAEQARMSEASRTFIEQIRSVCEQTFRPIYGPYMMPLVELANMGLSYRSQELENSLEEPAIAKDMGRWSRIVFLCEGLESIQMANKKPSSYESPDQVALHERRLIFDKSDKKLVAAIKATKTGLSRQKFVSQKVSKMAAEVRVHKSADTDNLANLVKDVKEGRLSYEDQDGAAQRILEVLDQYASYLFSS